MKREWNKKKLTMLLFLSLMATMLFCICARANIVNEKVEVKAGAAVVLKVSGLLEKIDDPEYEEVTWSASKGSMLYSLSPVESDFAEAGTVKVAGKTYQYYDTAIMPVMTMDAPADGEILVIAYQSMTVYAGYGGEYEEFPISVSSSNVTRISDVKVSTVKSATQPIYTVSYNLMQANGLRALENASVEVYIKNSAKKTVFHKTIKATCAKGYMFMSADKGGARNQFAVNGGAANQIKKGTSSTGTLSFTVKLSGGKKLKGSVKVKGLPLLPYATKIKMAKTLTVTKGFTKSLSVKTVKSGEKLQGLKFTSSNPKVSTVSSKGIVTAKGIGTATITCKLYNGKKYTCKVTVKDNIYNSGKTFYDFHLSDYRYGEVYLGLMKAWYDDNYNLVTTWTITNHRMFDADSFEWLNIKMTADGKQIARTTFRNVWLGIPEYGKKIFTFTFPASTVNNKKVDLRTSNVGFVDDYYYYYSY